MRARPRSKQLVRAFEDTAPPVAEALNGAGINTANIPRSTLTKSPLVDKLGPALRSAKSRLLKSIRSDYVIRHTAGFCSDYFSQATMKCVLDKRKGRGRKVISRIDRAVRELIKERQEPGRKVISRIDPTVRGFIKELREFRAIPGLIAKKQIFGSLVSSSSQLAGVLGDLPSLADPCVAENIEEGRRLKKIAAQVFNRDRFGRGGYCTTYPILIPLVQLVIFLDGTLARRVPSAALAELLKIAAGLLEKRPLTDETRSANEFVNRTPYEIIGKPLRRFIKRNPTLVDEWARYVVRGLVYDGVSDDRLHASIKALRKRGVLLCGTRQAIPKRDIPAIRASVTADIVELFALHPGEHPRMISERVFNQFFIPLRRLAANTVEAGAGSD